jgi:predicted nucleotidyltransferase
MKTQLKIDVPMNKIKDFCRRWRITEFSLFGSVLRDDFRPDSDVDVMVSFDEGAGWSLFDIVEMEEELKSIFGRDVDLVEKGAIRNPFRRHSIMKNREVLHAA